MNPCFDFKTENYDIVTLNIHDWTEYDMTRIQFGPYKIKQHNNKLSTLLYFKQVYAYSATTTAVKLFYYKLL